jgi:microcin C transport system substrate-binding protein
MTHYGFSASHSPGNELVDRFTSGSVDEKGSENLIGLRSPVVDALVKRILQASSREDLVAAARALDRVLMTGHYLVPHYFSRTHRVAYRRGLGVPKVLPRQYTAQEWVLSTWWDEP